MRNLGANEAGDVSRETWEKLEVFEGLVRKWSSAINLVAPTTLPDLRARHTDDSIFLAQTWFGTTSWMDLGSGGGFPGLIVAIICGEFREVILVESDQRKCEFLRAVRRELRLNVEILTERIENLQFRPVGVISARALAPLSRLLGLCERLVSPSTTLIFPKGRMSQSEVDASMREWAYDLNVLENPSSEGSVVLEIRNLHRVSR